MSGGALGTSAAAASGLATRSASTASVAGGRFTAPKRKSLKEIEWNDLLPPSHSIENMRWCHSFYLLRAALEVMPVMRTLYRTELRCHEDGGGSIAALGNVLRSLQYQLPADHAALAQAIADATGISVEEARGPGLSLAQTQRAIETFTRDRDRDKEPRLGSHLNTKVDRDTLLGSIDAFNDPQLRHFIEVNEDALFGMGGGRSHYVVGGYYPPEDMHRLMAEEVPDGLILLFDMGNMASPFLVTPKDLAAARPSGMLTLEARDPVPVIWDDEHETQGLALPVSRDEYEATARADTAIRKPASPEELRAAVKPIELKKIHPEDLLPHPMSIENQPWFASRVLIKAAYAELPVAAIYASLGLLRSQHRYSWCPVSELGMGSRSFGIEVPDNADELGERVAPLAGHTWLELRNDGLDLDELAAANRALFKPTWTTEVLRPGPRFTRTRFMDELESLNDKRQRHYANFLRPPLFYRGGGHHSPIGGYLSPRMMSRSLAAKLPHGLVMVVDVMDRASAFMTLPGPLYDSMAEPDRTGPEPHRPRGMIRIRPAGTAAMQSGIRGELGAGRDRDEFK